MSTNISSSILSSRESDVHHINSTVMATTPTSDQESFTTMTSLPPQQPSTAISNKTPLSRYLDETILARHSTRYFLPTPVPPSILESCLSLAQHAPSNSNIQPWRLYIPSDQRLSSLKQALSTAAISLKPTTAPIPEPYKHFRSALGHLLYGPDGYAIPRTDRDAHATATRRNYTFFDAPTVLIVCIDSALDQVDVMTVGMYLQTLLLLLTERDIASCVEVSVAGYPDVIREQLGIEKYMTVLCGVAIGYEDPSQRVNKLVMPREEWRKVVTFVD